MKIPNEADHETQPYLSLARIVSEDSQQTNYEYETINKSSKDS